jgi:hypothetical protein
MGRKHSLEIAVNLKTCTSVKITRCNLDDHGCDFQDGAVIEGVAWRKGVLHHSAANTVPLES